MSLHTLHIWWISLQLCYHACEAAGLLLWVEMTSQEPFRLVEVPLWTTQDDFKPIPMNQHNLTLKGKPAQLMIVQLRHLYFVIYRNDKQMKCYLGVRLLAAHVELSQECISWGIMVKELNLSTHLEGEIAEHINQIAHYNKEKNMKSWWNILKPASNMEAQSFPSGSLTLICGLESFFLFPFFWFLV